MTLILLSFVRYCIMKNSIDNHFKSKPILRTEPKPLLDLPQTKVNPIVFPRVSHFVPVLKPVLKEFSNKYFSEFLKTNS